MTNQTLLLFTTIFFISCISNSESVILDVKFHPNSIYKIEKETITLFPSYEDTIKSKIWLTIESKDLKEVNLSKMRTESNLLKNNDKDIDPFTFPEDLLINEICYSINGRSLTCENPMPQTKLAILLWNQQFEFPKNEIITKDTVTIHSNIQQNKIGEAITYDLEKVENNIAYINFRGKNDLSNNSSTKIQGELQYHIKDKYFKFIHTNRTTNLSQAESHQNDSIPKSQDSVKNYLITEISKIEKLPMK